MDTELLNKLQREVVERARQTNDESAWHDAQSLEYMIGELKTAQDHFKRIGARLGMMENFASYIISLCNEEGNANPMAFKIRARLAIMSEMDPEYFVTLKEMRNAGDGSTDKGSPSQEA